MDEIAKIRIEKAAETLKQGGIVLAPTDTVWGLMCDYANEQAVASIYSMKNSPPKPIAVLIDSIERAGEIKIKMTDQVKALAERYWPGSLTLIFQSEDEKIKHIAGENNTVGIRIPDSVALRELIGKFGNAVAATSANISGGKQPRVFDDVPDEITMSADYICHFDTETSGVASTVVDCTGDVLKILREGNITLEQLEEAVINR